jgi:hypothetical protein
MSVDGDLVRAGDQPETVGEARAPLHGDLVQALIGLGADRELLARAGVRT